MLERLVELTGSQEFRENGGMRIKEILMRPWEKDELKIIAELFIDDWESDKVPTQTWEITVEGMVFDMPRSLADGKPHGTQIKVLNNHPVLWNYTASSDLLVSGRCENVSALMGDLFMSHQRTCGGWVDFQAMYSGLPKRLRSHTKCHQQVPNELKASFIETVQKHGLSASVIGISEGESDLLVLFFSKTDIWPDELNFGQAHVVAKLFAETKIGETETNL